MAKRENTWYRFTYEGTAGERCDAALTMQLHQLAEFAELSRSRVQALIEDGGVLYDGKIVPRGQKNLRPGMRIEVDLELLRTLLRPLAPEYIEPSELPLEFLHVDDRIAVVLKPAGLTVHPAETTRGQPTLVGALITKFGQLSDHGGAERPGIVHRLDKETSGLMVIARDNLAHVSLARQFHERSVGKEYVALCIDRPELAQGRIELPIERHPRNRKLMWSKGGGRAALTEYRESGIWGPFALLDVAIHSGRTHQIRVHLQSIGVGIVNDDKYAPSRNASLRAFLGAGGYRHAPAAWKDALPEEAQRAELLGVLAGYSGIFLHARRLALVHPGTHERMEFEAPLPAVWDMVRDVTNAKQ